MIRATLITLVTVMLISLATVCSGDENAIKLTPEQEAQFKAGLKDPHIQFVRKALNQCIDNKFKSVECAPFVANNLTPEDLTGKFIVYWTEPRVVTGGFGVALIFLKNPNKIYNAIVFGSEQPYRLNNFYQAQFSEQKIKTIQQMLGPILTREDLAL